MTTEDAVFRHGAELAAAGLAITASLGLVGVGSSSAASALHIEPGAQWTAEVNGGGGCEVETFAANHTFRGGLYGDKGLWSDGRNKITMTWTDGYVSGLTFTGTFTKRPRTEYAGNFGGITATTGQLVKGAVSNWDGFTC
jgi:hypothetical protein